MAPAQRMAPRPQPEHDMSKNRFAGICLELSGWIREAWGELIGNEQMATAGRRDQTAGKVRQDSAFEREQAARQLKKFRDHNRNWLF
jgi:uncharacterized protein YjbJ (UPF0337 family)